MTTVAFQQSTTSVFSFQAQLDGQAYTVACPWNLSRQDYYVAVYDSQNNLIVTQPRVGSPDTGLGVNLVGGYFTASTLYYYPSSQTFVVLP